MSVTERDEVQVWTIDGYEGRFLRWEAGEWRAFEYRNYRHWFSPPDKLNDLDIRALREAYKGVALPDTELVRASPRALVKASAQ